MPPKPRSESPTMSDVARMAGVSQSCVSLVLNDAPGSRVPAKTRERVLRAASSLNYSLPHRGPRPSSTPVAKRTIAFVTDEISISPHTVLQINGVRDAAWAQEFLVQTYVTRSHKALEDATISAVLSDAGITGLIYANSFTRELELPSSQRTIPTVLVNCYMKTAPFQPCWPTMSAAGGRRPSICCRSGTTDRDDHRRALDGRLHDRLRGYRDALTSAGIEFDVSLVRYGDWSVASGYKRTLSLMGRPNPPTAFYCASDLMALGCFQALSSLGLSVPNDVSVVGHNDIDLAQYLEPALTSCRPPNYELGQRAVEILLDIVQGVDEHEAAVSRLDSKLILRSSVAAPVSRRDKSLNGNTSRSLAKATNVGGTSSAPRSATPSRGAATIAWVGTESAVTGTPTPSVSVVSRQRAILGERPLWWPERSTLLWVDIRSRSIHALDISDGTDMVWERPELTAGICLTADDRLLVAMESRIDLFNPDDGSVRRSWNMPHWRPGMRFNEMKCDPSGRVWVGSMDDRTRAPVGSLLRLTRDGLMPAHDSSVAVPNSLAWSLDGRCMYFADGLDTVIWRYDVDPQTGDLGPREPFHVLPVGSVPDGATVDSENFLWSANYGAGEVTRFTPRGSIDTVVRMPVSQPTSCGFGGERFDVLYMTSASQRLSSLQLGEQPLAGETFALKLRPQGLRRLASTLDTWVS